MKNLKNIIFDWDNTLFPFKEKYWESAHRKLFAANFDLSADELEDFMRAYHDYDEALWPRVHAHEMTIEELRNERLRLTLRYFGRLIDEDYVQGFFERFLQTLLDQIEPDEALIRKMEQLSAHFNIAILSNGGRWEQHEKLRRAGFEGKFPTYISGETGFLKPDPRAFTTLLTRENWQPEETMMVGDLLEHDIAPAQQLGLQTAYIGREKLTIADFEFETIGDFLDFMLTDFCHLRT